MPIVKSARKFQIFSQLFFIVVSLLWVAFVGFVAYFVDNTDVIKIVAVVSFIILIVIVIRFLSKKDKEFRCPDCGGKVDEPFKTGGTGGEPLLRYCEKCDVLWYVGNTPTPG